MPEPRLVIVPGLGNSGPEHWQTHLEQAHPGAIRVMQKHWEYPLRWQWVAALERLVRRLEAPAILVGHSAGVMTIVHWAARHVSPAWIEGALLVAPADMAARLPGLPPPWQVRLAGWTPIPARPLPWPSLLVASADDPYCALPRARHFAQAWGSEFVDIGGAGHINTDAGFGVWPEAETLLARLARRQTGENAC